MFFLGPKNRLIRGVPVAQCKLPLSDKCLGKRYINKGVCYVLVQARQQVFMVCPHKALKFTVFSSVVLESYFKNYYTSFSPSLCCYNFTTIFAVGHTKKTIGVFPKDDFTNYGLLCFSNLSLIVLIWFQLTIAINSQYFYSRLGK